MSIESMVWEYLFLSFYKLDTNKYLTLLQMAERKHKRTYFERDFWDIPLQINIIIWLFFFFKNTLRALLAVEHLKFGLLSIFFGKISKFQKVCYLNISIRSPDYIDTE